jgi:hypothetical protein
VQTRNNTQGSPVYTSHQAVQILPTYTAYQQAPRENPSVIKGKGQLLGYNYTLCHAVCSIEAVLSPGIEMRSNDLD